jgi:hypothetical protein
LTEPDDINSHIRVWEQHVLANFFNDFRIENDMDAPGSEIPEFWTKLYESAITEPDRTLRMARLLEAERAILERALVLSTEHTEHGTEIVALEEAAKFVREMKLNTMSDGVGKDLSPGDRELL